MQNLEYLLKNFFTHKDFLVPAEFIPGTMGTPLLFFFEAFILISITAASVYVSRMPKEKIMKIFLRIWEVFAVLEVVVVLWDTVAGRSGKFDFVSNLSLYPCSIYLYVCPFIFWGSEKMKKMAFGYITTLGFLGAVTAFIYPVRLNDYSCISFVGFHTLLYHGALFFTFLVTIKAGLHSYRGITRWQEVFYPSVPGLLLSIPANIINYSPLDADYMYFKGHFPLLSQLFPNTPAYVFTIVIYALYIMIPSFFYMPSYIANVKKCMESKKMRKSEKEEEPQLAI